MRGHMGQQTSSKKSNGSLGSGSSNSSIWIIVWNKIQGQWKLNAECLGNRSWHRMPVFEGRKNWRRTNIETQNGNMISKAITKHLFYGLSFEKRSAPTNTLSLTIARQSSKNTNPQPTSKRCSYS